MINIYADYLSSLREKEREREAFSFIYHFNCEITEKRSRNKINAAGLIGAQF